MRESHLISFSLVSCNCSIDFNCTTVGTLCTCAHTLTHPSPQRYSSKPCSTRKMALILQNWGTHPQTLPLNSEVSPASNLHSPEEGMRVEVDQMSHLFKAPHYHSPAVWILCLGRGLETMDHSQNSSWASSLLLASFWVKQDSLNCAWPDWCLPSSFPLSWWSNYCALESNRNVVTLLWFHTSSPIGLWECPLNTSAPSCGTCSAFAVDINLVLNLTEFNWWGEMVAIWDSARILRFESDDLSSVCFVLYF